MQKIFNKTLLHSLVLVLIGATVFTLSPLAVIVSGEEGFALSPSSVIPVISASEIIDFPSGQLSRTSHEEFAVGLQKIIAVYAVVVDAGVIDAHEIKLLAEWQHYAFTNDLHFNTPFLLFPQPASDHPSES